MNPIQKIARNIFAIIAITCFTMFCFELQWNNWIAALILFAAGAGFSRLTWAAWNEKIFQKR